MKILIVKLSAFGDIIHCLPALDDLIQRRQTSEIHWLLDSRYAFVGEILPQQVRVHQVSMKGEAPLASVWGSIRELRNIGFDAILDMQGLIKSAVMARSIGSRVFGIDRSELREKPAAWLQTSVCFHPQERHVVQQYRRVATAPFIDNCRQEPGHVIPYAAPHVDLANSSITGNPDLPKPLQSSNQPYVILHAAGGWETKQLPETTWIAVADGLLAAGIQPVFSWGNAREQELAKKMAEASIGYALPKRMNMSALTTLLLGAKAVVGADTGLLHLAAALNTPTITFWGPSASWRSAPFSEAQGARHWHIESNPSCGPCFKRTCEDFICMDAIQADAILGALHDI
ncbi:MAG TPA: lipopolysaccharide heptosyltransferase I [Mariprofundaceae bacterium]|nr:lipopolysaccharide heptosyltransferase I [Mariprofundaceae bacterium]